MVLPQIFPYRICTMYTVSNPTYMTLISIWLLGQLSYALNHRSWKLNHTQSCKHTWKITPTHTMSLFFCCIEKVLTSGYYFWRVNRFLFDTILLMTLWALICSRPRLVQNPLQLGICIWRRKKETMVKPINSRTKQETA